MIGEDQDQAAPSGGSPCLDLYAKDESPTPTKELVKSISPETFDQWYQEREFAQNIQNGTPYFNGPQEVKPPHRFTPSGFLGCHRKAVYNRANAPEETSDPDGIYWFGSRFEEDIILPYLQTEVAGENEYVTNSLWVDFTVESTAGEIRIKGATDPVIVDGDSSPLLVSEIKTKRSIDHVDSPSRHHRAQVHAYLKGLSEDCDQTLTQAVIIYGSRTDFDIKSFRIEFDPWFWREVVVDWAETQTTHRLNQDLPEAEPEFDWECDYCPFKMRCGEGSTRYADTGRTGLLPLFTGYPPQKLIEYLTAHEESKLTPSLAHQYPTIAAEYGVFDWYCDCGASHAWDAVDWDGDVTSPPMCPSCSESGDIRLLSGPSPSDQPPAEVSDVGK